MRNLLLSLGLGVALAATVSVAQAKVSEEKAAKLGDELTPVGAIPEGNEAGTIPEWKGEAVWPESLKNWSVEKLKSVVDRAEEYGKKHPDMNLIGYSHKNGISALFKAAEDVPELGTLLLSVNKENLKPRLTITADNYKQYADKLAAGYEKLFKLYPETYHMHVYPSVRGAYYPEEIYKWTQYNATHAALEGCADCITGAKIGFPFPIPTGGAQPIWNHKLKFRGSAIRLFNDTAVVDADGSFEITKKVQKAEFEYASLSQSAEERNNNLIFHYLQRTIAPPREAGQFILVHGIFGKNTSGRNAWLYNPGLGRVLRAPDVGFDNPTIGTDGLLFNDQVNMFNGSLARYNWKLVGKKPMFIPYNSYLMTNPIATYDDIIGDDHINQDMARYELHRVWVVEATLREGTSHQIAKRTFYIDEDSWSIVLVDNYDNRGNLWRFQEAHSLTFPPIPINSVAPQVVYDLLSGRYLVTAMFNEGTYPNWEVKYPTGFFLPSSLAEKGRLR